MDARSPLEKAIETLGFEKCYSLMDVQKIAKEEKITILELIKIRYKKKALLLHPDKNPGIDTYCRLKQIF